MKSATRIILLVTPFIACIWLINNLVHGDLSHFSPFWTDEISYWHQINSFASTGFGNGNYSINEIIKGNFVHYGPHGPFYIMLVGVLAKLFGYGAGAAIFYNLFFIFLATAVFIYLVRPNVATSIILILLFATSWFLLLYIPTAMQESLHVSFAIIIAALFYRAINDPRYLPILLSVICMASLTRPTWGIVLLVLPLLKAKSIRSFIVWCCYSVISMLVLFLMVSSLSSPYPNWLSSWVATGLDVKVLLDHFINNSTLLFSNTSSKSLEIVQRCFCAAFILYQIIILSVRVFRTKGKVSYDVNLIIPIFHIFNVASIFMITMLFYDIGYWRDFRVIAPHLFASIMIEVAAKRKIVPIIYVCMNLIFTPDFINTYKDFHQDRFVDLVPYENTWKSLSEYIKYDPSKGTWDNTLLVDLSHFNRCWLYVPHGIGVSFMLNEYPEQIKSKYVLISDEVYDKLKHKENLKIIATFPSGKLYVNN